jgi:bacteriocin biosynthesis cyclodehydratase domain-containing protein
MALNLPRIRTGWLYWAEPPGPDGLELLRFANCTHRATFEGEFVRELAAQVLPRLDGHHQRRHLVADVEGIAEWLDLFEAEGILADGPGVDLVDEPAIAFDPPGIFEAADRELLARRRVAIVGTYAQEARVVLGAAGATATIVDTATEGALAGADLLLWLRDTSWLGEAFDAADLAARSGMAFLPCRVAGEEVVMGGLVVPQKTPCYLCQEARRLSAAADPAFEAALLTQLRRRGERDWFLRQTSASVAASAARAAADEALRFLLGRDARSVGNLIVYSTAAAEAHPLAPVEGCKSCGGVRLRPRAPRELVSGRTGFVRRVEAKEICPGAWSGTAVLAHGSAYRTTYEDEIVVAEGSSEREAIDAAVCAAAAVRCGPAGDVPPSRWKSLTGEDAEFEPRPGTASIVAVAETLAAAARRAVYELFAEDAVHRFPALAEQIREESLPAAVRDTLAAARAAGHDPLLFLVSASLPIVVCVTTLDGEACVAAAAGMNPARASLAALLRGLAGAGDDLAARSLLAAIDREADLPTHAGSFRHCLRALEAAGHRFVAADVTSSELASVGLCAARVAATGFARLHSGGAAAALAAVPD